MRQFVSNILMAPEGGGGGGGSDWRSVLPEDLRNDPLLVAVKDIPDLAKQHVHAQRMLGDRLPKPKPDWKPEQWSELYNNLGRPPEHTKYKLPEYQFPEGFPEIDKGKMDVALKNMHGLGLTQPQLEGIMRMHFEELSSAHKAQSEARKTAHASCMAKLNERLGSSDKVSFALERARNAVKKLAGEGDDFDSLLDYVSDKGLDNNPEFLIMMSRVGAMMEEDKARGGPQGANFSATPSAAASEIDRLSMDAEFQKVLNDERMPGHKEAVARWLHVHSVAHPGKIRED